MDAQRTGLYRAIAIGFLCFNRVSQTLKGCASCIERGCDGCGEVSGNAVLDQELAQARQFCQGGSHDIEAAATVDVDVEISGYENSITEIDQPGIARDFRGGARRERDDLTVFNHEQRVANLFDRSE